MVFRNVRRYRCLVYTLMRRRLPILFLLLLFLDALHTNNCDVVYRLVHIRI